MTHPGPVNVSRLLPIPEFETWWWGDHFTAVHRQDGTVISGATYRECVLSCLIERARRMGLHVRARRQW